jgi:hypothetical protein
MSTNLVFHGDGKHIEIDFHSLCEKIAHEALDIQLITSGDQLAFAFAN